MSTPVVDHASEQRVVEVGMSTTVLDHTPRGHASRYVSACYTGMRDDVARTSAYRQAIIEAAPGKVVVDLGTGALAEAASAATQSAPQYGWLFCETGRCPKPPPRLRIRRIIEELTADT